MTDSTYLTYQGPFPRGIQSLPGRRVLFTRGVPVEFTVDEIEHLDGGYWVGERVGPAIDGERTQQGPTLKAGDAGELTLDGKPLGPIDAVLAEATSPEKAGELLRLERAGKNRATLVARLEDLASIDPAGDPEPDGDQDHSPVGDAADTTDPEAPASTPTEA